MVFLDLFLCTILIGILSVSTAIWLSNSAKFQTLVTAQMQEMEMIRQKLYTLEQQQVAIKNRYHFSPSG